MKLGNLKPVKRPSRIRRFFSNLNRKIAGKYINDIHPGFMSYIGNSSFAASSIWLDYQAKRRKKILKLLNSEKYKKFFFKAITYQPNVKEKPIIDTRWYVVALDKLIYFLSKSYVFLFKRELYKKIKHFEKVSSEYGNLAKRVDEYIASTTFEERLCRMHATGLISDQCFQEDFNVLINRVSIDTIEARKKEKLECSYANINGMKRPIPNGVLNLIRATNK